MALRRTEHSFLRWWLFFEGVGFVVRFWEHGVGRVSSHRLVDG